MYIKAGSQLCGREMVESMIASIKTRVEWAPPNDTSKWDRWRKWVWPVCPSVPPLSYYISFGNDHIGQEAAAEINRRTLVSGQLCLPVYRLQNAFREIPLLRKTKERKCPTDSANFRFKTFFRKGTGAWWWMCAHLRVTRSEPRSSRGAGVPAWGRCSAEMRQPQTGLAPLDSLRWR